MFNLIEALNHCIALLNPGYGEDIERIKLIRRLIRALEHFDPPADD